ncbi:MAG: ABC transporter permease subunit [Clostridiales bacterium]|nr:ABC transporter permease subunit [Clostridiales bacterium]
MYFELKKIFSKTSSKVALLFLFGFMIYLISIANSVVWLNEDGTELTGKAAAKKIREAEQKWYGPLTEEKIADVITQNWDQGNREIRTLIAKAFGGLDTIDTMIVDTLTADDAANFYKNRINSVKNWLEEQEDWYTQEEKTFITEQYKDMEVPLNYEYTKGWTKLFPAVSNLQTFLVFVIGFLVAGIFSEEYRTGSYSIYFSSAHGRGKAITAKIKAGFFLITAVYWISFLLFSFLVLNQLGFGGGDSQIQTSMIGWGSFYNITFKQEYFMIAAGGYIGCLFIDSLAMLVSAKTKSTVVSVIVPFAVIFAPSVIGVINTPLAEKINGLMPYQLIQMNSVISEFYLYKIMGQFIKGAGILLILYMISFIALQPVTYLIFKRGKAQ